MKNKNDLYERMEKRKFKGILFLFFTLSFMYGVDDNEFWTSITFEKNLPLSLKLELEQELRFKDQLSTFKQTFSEISFSYKVFKGLRIKIPYRHLIYEDKTKQRLSLEGSYKFSLKPISFKSRTKFQRTYEDEEDPDDLIRNKISIHYKWNKKIEPYLSGEIFHIHNTSKDRFDEYRFSFGLAVNLPRKNSIKIFYLFKKEDIAKSSPDMINVFGIGYGFE